jgi:hypothetical protein
VRYRVLVLLATFAGLRWGELIALRRHNIDLEACEIRIVETTAQLDTGLLLPETPKSRAGRRTVAFPGELVPEIRWHPGAVRRAGGSKVWFSSAQGRGCGVPTSGGYGPEPALKPVCPACIFMICGIRAAPWPPPPVRPLRN